MHCAGERRAIVETIARAMTLDCCGTVNPYGDGRSSGRIIDILRSLPPGADLLRKSFHMVESGRV